MKNILLILVGGTICTATNEFGTLSVNEKAGVMLKENYLHSDSAFADSVEIDLTKNMFILSENMTVNKWNSIIAMYRKKVVNSNYDGVIFAHGTDSLAYSSSLFSMALSDTEIPVFFVSSNAKLSSPRANGNANFRYAVECICEGISPNVYVTYKNISDGRMYLHLASRLKQCENYSEDFFSVGAMDITDMAPHNHREYFQRLDAMYPRDKKYPLVSIRDAWELKNRVLMLEPYVGLRYDAIDFSRFAAILHGTYHSGTVCVEDWENSILGMIDECIDNPHVTADIYISPTQLSGEVYETITTMYNHRRDELPVTFLYGMTKETAYAKLVLAYSLYSDKEDILRFMETEINFENLYE